MDDVVDDVDDDEFQQKQECFVNDVTLQYLPKVEDLCVELVNFE